MKKFKPNLEYFEKSISKLKTYLTLKKFDFAPIELTSNTPCIYVSPKTSQIDKYLISKCIKDKTGSRLCGINLNGIYKDL